MVYPKSHKAIVENLMKGKFILTGDRLFEIIKENEDFYIQFFEISFGYNLVTTKNEFYYLTSNDSNEKFSRDISVFFAVLCYEIDKDGKNFLDALRYNEFEISAIEKYFETSNYKDIIDSNNNLKDIRKFIPALASRNILEKLGEDRIIFTSAFKVFTDYAIEIAKKSISNIEESQEEDNKTEQ